MNFFSIISIALIAATVEASSTAKVVRRKRSVEKQRRSLLSVSERISKQKQAFAIVNTIVTSEDYAPTASRSDSFQCFLDTITTYYDYGPYLDESWYYTECDEEWNCDFSTVEMEAGCEEAGGVVERVTMTFCPDYDYPYVSTWLSYPYCVAPNCGGESFKDIFLEYYAPLSYNVGLGDQTPESEYFTSYEEYLGGVGFGECSTPSSKAPKSSKSPSSKAPKSSKSPSSKAPKSSKSPSSKAPKSTKTPKATSAPSSKAPKSSTKSPKSTKAPGAVAGAVSSAATASMSAASVAAGALVWFSL